MKRSFVRLSDCERVYAQFLLKENEALNLNKVEQALTRGISEDNFRGFSGFRERLIDRVFTCNEVLPPNLISFRSRWNFDGGTSSDEKGDRGPEGSHVPHTSQRLVKENRWKARSEG